MQPGMLAAHAAVAAGPPRQLHRPRPGRRRRRWAARSGRAHRGARGLWARARPRHHRPPAGLDARTPPSVLRFEAATTSENDGGSAEGLAPPRELDDGSAGTVWASRRGVGTRFVARGQTARVLALRLLAGDAASARALRA